MQIPLLFSDHRIALMLRCAIAFLSWTLLLLLFSSDYFKLTLVLSGVCIGLCFVIKYLPIFSGKKRKVLLTPVDKGGILWYDLYGEAMRNPRRKFINLKFLTEYYLRFGLLITIPSVIAYFINVRIGLYYLFIGLPLLCLALTLRVFFFEDQQTRVIGKLIYLQQAKQIKDGTNEPFWGN